jgi:hypothetical protein
MAKKRRFLLSFRSFISPSFQMMLVTESMTESMTGSTTGSIMAKNCIVPSEWEMANKTRQKLATTVPAIVVTVTITTTAVIVIIIIIIIIIIVTACWPFNRFCNEESDDESFISSWFGSCFLAVGSGFVCFQFRFRLHFRNLSTCGGYSNVEFANSIIYLN